MILDFGFWIGVIFKFERLQPVSLIQNLKSKIVTFS